MAKIKVKKESVLKLRFTEHSGQEWELWENFCRDLCDLFEALAFKGFWLNVAAKSQGLIWIHQGTAEKALDKEIIKELAQKHKIEIEFEEEKEKKEEEKWVPVHGIIEEIITRNSKLHVRTIATLYAMGGKIPPKAAGKLIEDLENASLSIIMDANLRTLVDRAIKNLKQQQKEG